MRNYNFSVFLAGVAVLFATLLPATAATAAPVPDPEEVFLETWKTRGSQLNINTSPFNIVAGTHNTDNDWYVLLTATARNWNLLSSTTDSHLKNGSGGTGFSSFRSYLPTPCSVDDWSSFTLSGFIRYSDTVTGSPVDGSRTLFYIAADGGDRIGETNNATVPGTGYAFYINIPQASYTHFGGFVVTTGGTSSTLTIGAGSPPARINDYTWSVTFAREGANTRVQYNIIRPLQTTLSGVAVIPRALAPGTILDRKVIRSEDGARTRNDQIDDLQVTAVPLRPEMTHDAGATISFPPIALYLSESAKETSFTLQNTGIKDLTIQSLVTDPSPRFSVVSPTSPTFAIAPDSSQVVTLRFAETTPGPYAGTLTINSDDPTSSALVIGLFGSAVQDPPIISHDAGTTITFAPIDLDLEQESTETTFTIQNLGTGSLYIGSLTAAPSRFSVVSPATPFAIDPGLSQEVRLRLTETVKGDYSGTLTIGSDDPSSPSVVIGLAGSVVKAPLPAIPRLYFLETWNDTTNLPKVVVDGTSGRNYALTPATDGTDNTWQVLSPAFGMGTWQIESVGAPLNSTALNYSAYNTATPAGTNTNAGYFRSMLETPIATDEFSHFTINFKFRYSLGTGTTTNMPRAWIWLAANGGTVVDDAGIPSNGFAIHLNGKTDRPAESFGGVRVADGVDNTEIWLGDLGNQDMVMGVLYEWTATFSRDGSNTRVEWTVQRDGQPYYSGDEIIARAITPGTVLDRVVIMTRTRPRFSLDDITILATPFAPEIAHDAGEEIVFPAIRQDLSQTSQDATFNILNTGSKDLTIHSLVTDPSLRFSVVSPASAPFVIAPDGSQLVTLRFSETTLGTYPGTLTIHSDDPSSPTLDIGLVGSVVAGPPEIAHDAGTTITFPAINRDLGQDSSDATFTIQNTGLSDLTVSSIEAEPSRFSVISPAEAFVVPTGEDQEIRVRITETNAGNYAGILTIVSDADSSPTVTIALAGSVIGSPNLDHDAGATITFDPIDLYMGQESMDATVTIQNIGFSDLSISALSATAPFTVVSPAGGFVIAPGDNQEVLLRIWASAVGTYSGTLTIHSNDPTSPTLGIALSASVTGPPLIAHNAGATITFDPILLNLGQSSKDATFTIQNIGFNDLTVSALLATPARFSVVSPEGAFVIAPNQSRLVTIRLTETALGDYTGSLTIQSDDPNTPEILIGLEGQVIGDTPDPASAGHWNRY